MRKKLYPRATLVGTAAYTGTSGDADELAKYAGSLGADVVIWRESWLTTDTYTTYFQGNHDTTIHTLDDNGHRTTVHIEEPDDEPWTHHDTIYEQTVLYLRTTGASGSGGAAH